MRGRGSPVPPSMVTLGGLLLAFWSLTLTSEGRYEAAAWVIFAAACADVVDGGLARSLGAISPFGKQLDSLTDLVAAGVAPAFLVHSVYFDGWGALGVLVAFAWVAFVAVRLARFNTTVLADPLYFIGVPCPIAATVVAQYVVFSRGTWGDDGQAWVGAVMIFVLGALMLSRVPYWKSATLLPRHFFHHAYGPGVVALGLVAIPLPRQAVFSFAAASIVTAAAVHAIHATRRVPVPVPVPAATIAETRIIT